MAATQATYLQIRKRTQYLRGETDTAGDTVINDHIQAAVRDILNTYPFSWNITATNLTLSSGTADFPADYNPKWDIDARISNSSVADDNIFNQITIRDRDAFDTSSYAFWRTYNTSTSRHAFNTKIQSGTVTLYYHFWPTDLSADADVCIIPDWEAVAYLAAAKMFVGDERNVQLKADYEQEASSRIQALYQADMTFGPMDKVMSPVSFNPELTGGSYYSDLKIARS